MNIAIIKTGGKQYKVEKDDVIDVELLDKEEKTDIEFQDILNGRKIKAQVIGTTKGPKISNLKFKNKTRYTKRGGHRQKYSTIKILDIK